MASARADVLIDGCTEAASDTPPAVASLASVRLSKGRYMQWTVGIVSVDTDSSPVGNGTEFEGEGLSLVTTWQQGYEPRLRLNASGDVVVQGPEGVRQAKVGGGALGQPWWRERRELWWRKGGSEGGRRERRQQKKALIQGFEPACKVQL